MGIKSDSMHTHTQKGKRVLKDRQPKIIENTKQCIYMRGGKTSPNVMAMLKDIAAIKKPYGLMLGRKNDVHPFDDDTFMEKLCRQNDCSLFAIANHSKKRPDNLVLGRMFDGHLLDMVEFGVGADLVSLQKGGASMPMGVKPVLVFTGTQFESNTDWRRIRSLLIDFFRGEAVEQIRPTGCVIVMAFVITSDTTLKLCTYRAAPTTEGAQLNPSNASLEQMGPSCTLTLRRHKLASDDLAKIANKQPRTAKMVKTKNVTKDVFGSVVARVHVGKQEINSIQVRKHKALKRRVTATGGEGEEEGSGDEQDDGEELQYEDDDGGSGGDEDGDVEVV